MYYTNSIKKLWDIGKSISSCMPITIYNKISWVTMASYEPTQQPIVSKRARLGRYFCFCSSLPNMAAHKKYPPYDKLPSCLMGIGHITLIQKDGRTA
jgi:hypothetical protein